MENDFFVKAEKCSFHSSSVSFLGYVIQSVQVKPDPKKINSMAEWQTPSTRKQKQHFLGFANFYSCFIRNYSRIVTPLN